MTTNTIQQELQAIDANAAEVSSKSLKAADEEATVATETELTTDEDDSISRQVGEEDINEQKGAAQPKMEVSLSSFLEESDSAAATIGAMDVSSIGSQSLRSSERSQRRRAKRQSRRMSRRSISLPTKEIEAINPELAEQEHDHDAATANAERVLKLMETNKKERRGSTNHIVTLALEQANRAQLRIQQDLDKQDVMKAVEQDWTNFVSDLEKLLPVNLGTILEEGEEKGNTKQDDTWTQYLPTWGMGASSSSPDEQSSKEMGKTPEQLKQDDWMNFDIMTSLGDLVMGTSSTQATTTTATNEAPKFSS